MGDDQDAAAKVPANPFDQLIYDVRSGGIDALFRFVEDQQIGPVNSAPAPASAAGVRRPTTW